MKTLDVNVSSTVTDCGATLKSVAVFDLLVTSSVVVDFEVEFNIGRFFTDEEFLDPMAALCDCSGGETAL